MADKASFLVFYLAQGQTVLRACENIVGNNNSSSNSSSADNSSSVDNSTDGASNQSNLE